jgi:3-methyladenine DNA glycosylase/8-oxoguanine DNA glycosylase
MSPRTVPFDKDPAAVEHLRAADPVMAGIIERIGKPTMRDQMLTDFESLGRAILYQQLAGAAALAIEKRFRALFSPNGANPPPPDAARQGKGARAMPDLLPFPTPEQLLATEDDTLRAAGLSRQKTAYLKDLAAHFADGRLRDKELEKLSDQEVIERVVQVKGVGRWTAEMFLIFQLRRPDILPVDDLGVRNAFKRMYGLDEAPSAEKMRELAEPWRPYRSLGTWYLWQSFDFVLMGEDNRPRTRPSS